MRPKQQPIVRTMPLTEMQNRGINVGIRRENREFNF